MLYFSSQWDILCTIDVDIKHVITYSTVCPIGHTEVKLLYTYGT